MPFSLSLFPFSFSSLPSGGSERREGLQHVLLGALSGDNVFFFDAQFFFSQKKKKIGGKRKKKKCFVIVCFCSVLFGGGGHILVLFDRSSVS